MKVILVVEDEYAIAGLLRELLQDEGYRVVLAGNGREALQSLKQTRPDLILSDVMMPDMDGRALATAVRADSALRQVPIVLMSAGANAVDGLGIHIDAFMPKPFDVTQLLTTIERLTDV